MQQQQQQHCEEVPLAAALGHATARDDGSAPELVLPDFESNPIATARIRLNRFGGGALPHKTRGVLKPTLLFFGENLHATVRTRIDQLLQPPRAHDDAATPRGVKPPALIVMGSSLTVYSAYRIALQAAAARHTLVVLNHGATRADGNLNIAFRSHADLSSFFE